MPLWQIYHPPGVFADAESKAGLSKALTSLYANEMVGLPAFYVAVYFLEVPAASTYVGGVARDAADATPFVRLVALHTAAKMSPEWYDGFCDKVVQTTKPYIQDKGYDWEFSISEGPGELWRVQGLRAPPRGSEPFKEWVKENKAIPWE